MEFLRDYISIARPNHWFKNVFAFPGYICAIFLSGGVEGLNITGLILSVTGLSLAASANYVINEWLDARFDAHHPIKKNRPSVRGKVKKFIILLEYGILSFSGLFLGYLESSLVLFSIFLLLFSGIVYNVKPFRLKDVAFVDVLVESINNPIRFLVGWFVVAKFFPPVSILLSFWMAGAFLMSIKRYAELRCIGDKRIAQRYRESFRYYTVENLLLSALFYAMNFAFFLGIFLIKHRIEFLLSFPFFSALFCWYLFVGMKENSPAQRPEALYREKNLFLFVVALFLLVWVLLRVDIPLLRFFLG